MAVKMMTLEQEAHRFAANMLISPMDARRLSALSTTSEVEQFASEIGIAPGVVVGRLHHERLWDWNKGNKLRRRLQIVSE